MKARFAGKCARTGKSYPAGTEIKKGPRGWEIAGPIASNPTTVTTSQEFTTPDGARVIIGRAHAEGRGEEEVIECPITVEIEGQRFHYRARNIFDFGLVLNPPEGGLAENVEQFLAYNYTHADRDDAYWKDQFRLVQSISQRDGAPYASPHYGPIEATTWEEYRDKALAKLAAQNAEFLARYRAERPTETGWGWENHIYEKDAQGNYLPQPPRVEWRPMSELEVRAYQIALTHVPGALRGMRM
jgi:hypothetical protein